MKASHRRVVDALKRGGSLSYPSLRDGDKSYLMTDLLQPTKFLWVRKHVAEEMFEANIITRDHLNDPIRLVKS